MKKFISILLAVMLVVSASVVSFGAYNSTGDYSVLSPGSDYTPSDSYTVDAKTPYAEDVVVACGGSLDEVQTLYFQVPLNDGIHPVWENKYNTFAGPDDDEPYMHVCVYWWGGIGSTWPNGTGVKWCGYQAHLVDKENRIYSAQLPADGGTPLVVWNNGVNGGMDKTADIYNYAAQIFDANIEGAGEGEYGTLPEGTPDEWTMDGCIQIINYEDQHVNDLTQDVQYGSNWYIYYGQGCYGSYARTSDHFVSQIDNCLNPEHYDNGDPATGTHIEITLPAEPGDANNDKSIDALDVLCIQRHLAQLPQAEGVTLDKKGADADQDGYISIIDATRIQRFLAKMCKMDGTKL